MKAKVTRYNRFSGKKESFITQVSAAEYKYNLMLAKKKYQGMISIKKV